MNGLCPACRRPYNDKDIEYKVVTPEETAAHKARQAQKQKKTQAALQKERQRAEADTLSRKHLAGLRVVQKNLVYVTGLSPHHHEDALMQTLRGNDYFGQYGKIIKIVVSKLKDRTDAVGVYVTYERKEDAANCIAAVDGSKNGDKTLRAQFGTTKYCSAYLRGDTCMNRNCMFLHEPGEANESYSRADLSALNAGSTQHGGQRQPPPQSQQPVAAQPMAQQSSDRPSSPAADRPALPSTASWASRPAPQPSRNESRSTSGTVESPAVTSATPAPSLPDQEPLSQVQPIQPLPQSESRPRRTAKPRVLSPLLQMAKNFSLDDLRVAFSPARLSQADLDIINLMPPLFDANGGARRRARRQREEEERRLQQETQPLQQPPGLEIPDDNPETSGSMQLGGEPEERPGQPQLQVDTDGGLDQRFRFGGVASPGGLGDRGLTPQQQQQLLLQTMKSPNGLNAPSAFGSSLQQPGHPPGHQRNVSRFSFANDSNASTSVKPVANQKLLNQQSSMMPPAGTTNHFGAQQASQGGQFYTSNVQGPPPGLKTTGTPPVSGGMTFGQGHGFTTGGLQYGNTAAGGRNANEEMMRDLLRGQSRGVDASKRELNNFPTYTSPNSSVANAYQTQAFGGPNAISPAPYASSMSSYGGGDDGKQRSKKKGKKHRHANTSSSSGGAGVSDLADNHLLQARLHQGMGPFGGAAGGLQFSNAMHGAGGYGGRW